MILSTWSLAGALGQVIFQRTVMQRLAAGAFERGDILRVLHALQEFLVIFDGDDHRDGFPVARHNFRFRQCRFHVSTLTGSTMEGKDL